MFYLHLQELINVYRNFLLFGVTMIKNNLSTIMGERRLKIVDVINETSLNRGTVTRVYNDTAVKIDISTVDELCKYLKVGVGELFEYVED